MGCKLLSYSNRVGFSVTGVATLLSPLLQELPDAFPNLPIPHRTSNSEFPFQYMKLIPKLETLGLTDDRNFKKGFKIFP